MLLKIGSYNIMQLEEKHRIMKNLLADKNKANSGSQKTTATKRLQLAQGSYKRQKGPASLNLNKSSCSNHCRYPKQACKLEVPQIPKCTEVKGKYAE